jgi:hypothetical protein
LADANIVVDFSISQKKLVDIAYCKGTDQVLRYPFKIRKRLPQATSFQIIVVFTTG